MQEEVLGRGEGQKLVDQLVGHRVVPGVHRHQRHSVRTEQRVRPVLDLVDVLMALRRNRHPEEAEIPFPQRPDLVTGIAGVEPGTGELDHRGDLGDPAVGLGAGQNRLDVPAVAGAEIGVETGERVVAAPVRVPAGPPGQVVEVTVVPEKADRDVVHRVVEGDDVDEFRCVLGAPDDQPGRFQVDAGAVGHGHRGQHVTVGDVVPPTLAPRNPVSWVVPAEFP